MFRILVLLSLSLLLLSACGAPGQQIRKSLEEYPQQYRQFDAQLAWRITPAGAESLIDGVLKNVRYYEMNELEIWVFTLDASGHETNRAVSFVSRLKEQELGSFRLTIPRVSTGQHLRFIYRYRPNEGGDRYDQSTPWLQSFDVTVP